VKRDPPVLLNAALEVGKLKTRRRKVKKKSIVQSIVTREL
jgi:hypothetical protein